MGGHRVPPLVEEAEKDGEENLQNMLRESSCTIMAQTQRELGLRSGSHGGLNPWLD